MEGLVFACSGGQVLQAQSFKIHPHRVYLEKEPFTPAERLGKYTIATSAFLLNGILIASNEDADFLPDLLLVHCFQKDDYTLREGKTEPSGICILYGF